YYDDEISVFFGDGAGGFTTKTDYAVGHGPNWVSLADINADNIADFVTANHLGNGMTVLLGDGAATSSVDDKLSIRLNDGLANWSGVVQYATGDEPVTVDAGDLNLDGKVD